MEPMVDVRSTPPPAPVPSEFKVWCMLHTENSVLGVDLSLATDIDTLKKRIKAEMELHFPAPSLLLLKVTTITDAPVTPRMLSQEVRQHIASGIHNMLRAGRNIEDEQLEDAAFGLKFVVLSPFMTVEECGLNRAPRRQSIDILVVLPPGTHFLLNHCR